MRGTVSTRKTRVISILATLGLVAGMLAVTAGSGAAATKAHSETIEVRCPSSSFIADANAFAGQKREVKAFYLATLAQGSPVVCEIYDGETQELLFNPAA